MSAVAVLAMLISKVLDKARELSARFFEAESIPPSLPKEEKTILKEPTDDPSTQKREL